MVEICALLGVPFVPVMIKSEPPADAQKSEPPGNDQTLEDEP
jgi:hypothetical protein